MGGSSWISVQCKTVISIRCKLTESLIDQVVGNNIRANAVFEADNTVIIAPATVQFTDFSFGEPDQWAWDFDSDGVIDSTVQNPTHTFNVTGKYTVTLSIDGPYGQDTQTIINYIMADTDNDTDGIPYSIDNCPGITNTSQVDNENDGLGDACDSDDDNDGLTDVEEMALGTNPFLTDTDGDGYSDGLEVTVGSDPLNDQHTFLDVAGDINGDGEINAGDLVLGATILFGTYSPTPSEQARFDIAPLSCGLPVPDGNNNVGDYLILLRLVSGNILF